MWDKVWKTQMNNSFIIQQQSGTSLPNQKHQWTDGLPDFIGIPAYFPTHPTPIHHILLRPKGNKFCGIKLN